MDESMQNDSSFYLIIIHSLLMENTWNMELLDRAENRLEIDSNNSLLKGQACTRGQLDLLILIKYASCIKCSHSTDTLNVLSHNFQAAVTSFGFIPRNIQLSLQTTRQ